MTPWWPFSGKQLRWLCFRWRCDTQERSVTFVLPSSTLAKSPHEGYSLTATMICRGLPLTRLRTPLGLSFLWVQLPVPSITAYQPPGISTPAEQAKESKQIPQSSLAKGICSLNFTLCSCEDTWPSAQMKLPSRGNWSVCVCLCGRPTSSF